MVSLTPIILFSLLLLTAMAVVTVRYQCASHITDSSSKVGCQTWQPPPLEEDPQQLHC